MKALLCLSVILAPLAAMAQYGPGYGGAQSPYGPNVQWTTLLTGVDSRIQQRGQVMISNQNQWESIYRQMSGIAPNARCNVPMVADWGRQSLIIIHTGAVQTPGYSVYVQTIGRSTSGFFDVQCVVNQPNPNSRFQTGGYYSPFAIIRIDNTIGVARYYYTPVISQIIHSGYNNCGCGCHNHGGGVYMWQNGQLVDLTKQGNNRPGGVWGWRDGQFVDLTQQGGNNNGGGKGNGNGHGHGNGDGKGKGSN